jgi:hypothetical protein
MPYSIKREGGKYCVVKKTTGAKVACHPTQAEAMKHMRALLSKVPDAKKYSLAEMTLQLAGLRAAAPDAPGAPVLLPELVAAPPAIESNTAPIRLYFQEGERTPDGRIIDPNAVNFNRPPPFAIRLQTRQPESGGHAGAEVCGVITRITRDGLTIVCDGVLDLNTPAGLQAYQLISARTMQTWSPDLGDAVVDIEENYADEDPNIESGLDQVAHFVRATFLGATLVAMPALASAVVELLSEDGSILVPAPSRTVEPADPVAVSTDPDDDKHITDRQDHQPFQVSACAGPAAPPSSFFAKQPLTELQRWTEITPEGHVYGHSAGRDECHIGYFDQCVTIDMIADVNGEGSFEYAMPGHVVTAEGTKIATGPIALKGGHADKGLSWRRAISHYDDPSAVIADVCYYVDDYGIQFSGALRPGVTADQVHALRASGVSLDAREIDGKLRYLATCCVNTPGFPKAQARLVASADGDTTISAVIALGGPPVSVQSDDDCGCD